MTTICKNCNNHFQGHFCNNCGQPAETAKISIHFLWHDLQHGLLHLDKGILYTSKELFTRPGHSIREFIEGKRVKHFKPISLVLVLAGILGLLYHFFHISILEGSVVVTSSDKNGNEYIKAFKNISDWITEHYAIVTIIQLPVFALCTFMVFRKVHYNFTEHLVLNSFLTGQKLIYHIILFPLIFFYSATPTLKPIIAIENLLDFGLTVWVFIQFFASQNKWGTFWRTILSLILYLLFLGILISIGIFIYLKTKF
jgi:hypothetical protein